MTDINRHNVPDWIRNLEADDVLMPKGGDFPSLTVIELDYFLTDLFGVRVWAGDNKEYVHSVQYIDEYYNPPGYWSPHSGVPKLDKAPDKNFTLNEARIAAVQFDGHEESIKDFLPPDRYKMGNGRSYGEPKPYNTVTVYTSRGELVAKPHDFIIYFSSTVFAVVGPEFFVRNYSPILDAV